MQKKGLSNTRHEGGYSWNILFLLAAGFGTRLRPLTLHRPKPLLPLLGFPMVQYAVTWLRQHGHDNIIVNAHHLWEHVAEWSEKEGLGLQVELPDILGTGGGLRAARDRLAEKFLVWNGDIVCDIDPNALLDECPVGGASMALRYSADLKKTTKLLTDEEGLFRGSEVCVLLKMLQIFLLHQMVCISQESMR